MMIILILISMIITITKMAVNQNSTLYIVRLLKIKKLPAIIDFYHFHTMLEEKGLKYTQQQQNRQYSWEQEHLKQEYIRNRNI